MSLTLNDFRFKCVGTKLTVKFGERLGCLSHMRVSNNEVGVTVMGVEECGYSDNQVSRSVD